MLSHACGFCAVAFEDEPPVTVCFVSRRCEELQALVNVDSERMTFDDEIHAAPCERLGLRVQYALDDER